MAPVYDFRHVELDKIGRGKRIVKPPGGECSDIFGVQNGASPKQEQITPRKTKNYMQSNIFSPDSPDSASPNGHTAVTPAKALDTQERLFGGSPDEDTPRRVVYRQRSSIFEDEVSYSRNTPRTTPVRRTEINPITGEPVSQNGTPNGGSANGTPNGTQNGGNGYIRRNQINPITGEPMCQNGMSYGSASGTPNKVTNGCIKYFRRNPINPITGEPMCLNGSPKGSAYGSPYGATNGFNGYRSIKLDQRHDCCSLIERSGPDATNGLGLDSDSAVNGHYTPESPMNGSSARVRNPPGGKSSGIF